MNPAVVHEVERNHRGFSAIFLKALVSRVNRRIDMRMVSFCRSTWLEEMWRGSGDPQTSSFRVPMILAGL
jgi:hypothetical protein